MEPEEARALLAKFRPSADQPRHRDAVDRIVRAVERLAVAVASVGALMAVADDDDWASYADRLERIPLDDYADAYDRVRAHTGYSGRVIAALDDLFDRLPLPARRVMEYAAILPEDSIPAPDYIAVISEGTSTGDWLALLLAADADPARGEGRLGLGTRITGSPRKPEDFVKKLQSLGLLTPASPDRTLWSMHRLHAKRCRERVGAVATTRYVDSLEVFVYSIAKSWHPSSERLPPWQEVIAFHDLGKHMGSLSRTTAHTAVRLAVRRIIPSLPSPPSGIHAMAAAVAQAVGRQVA
jgi:hypothetical protein